MTFTNNIKKQVDLPVWEWLRTSPVTAANTTVMTTSDGMTDQYLYVLITATEFYRYDTVTDTWQKLASPSIAPVTPCALRYATYNGYKGRVISNINNTQFVAAGLDRDVLDGYKIRIIAGTGMGQERTITAVSKPTVLDFGVASAGNTLTVTDSAKAWSFNQYINYQVRCTLNTGAPAVRKILYNSATVLSWADTNWGNYENRYYGSTTALAAGSVYQIESSVFTVDTDWTVNPDSTSRFLILSGGIWLTAALATAPWITIQFYDIAADTWYQQTTATGVPHGLAAAIGTDITIERTGEVMGSYLTGTHHASTPSTATTFVNSNSNLTPNRWNGYAIKITGGTGLGQYATIIANTSGVFTINEAWEFIPDNTSTYSIYGDSDKIYFMGAATGCCSIYSADNDIWAFGAHYDAGICAIGYVKLLTPSGVLANHKPFALSALTATTVTGTATTVLNHNFKVGDHVAIGGAITNTGLNNANATIATVPSLTTFTYSNTTNASATFTALSATVIVDSTKNWVSNEHQGKYVNLIVGTSPNAATQIGQMRRITSNTPTTLTIDVIAGTAMTAGVNGTSRYVIYDSNVHGIYDMSYEGVNYTEKTGGSATVFTAVLPSGSDKTWVASALIGRKIRFISGSLIGQERTISSNTTTQITTAAFTGNATAGDSFRLMVDWINTGTSATVAAVAGTPFIASSLIGRRLKYITGVNIGQEQTITANTNSTITTAAFAAVPVGTENFVIIGTAPRGLGIQAIWNGGATNTDDEGKYIYCFRGGVTPIVDRLNLTTGLWEVFNYFPQTDTFTTGTNYAYDGVDKIYIQKDGTLRFYVLNLNTNKLTPSGTIAYTAATGTVGNRMEIVQTIDGIAYLYFLRASAIEFFRTLIFW